MATSRKDKHVTVCRASGATVSDRCFARTATAANEAQLLELLPAGGTRRPKSGSYITIPQATDKRRAAQPPVLVGRGNGANEHGVVIGNEAMFASGGRKRPRRHGPVRLGLEARLDAATVDLITGLLEKHGQGGTAAPAGFTIRTAFIVADPKEALSSRPSDGGGTSMCALVRALSNALSIGVRSRVTAWCLHAQAQGLHADGSFDFAAG
jgi:hypothetical protein